MVLDCINNNNSSSGDDDKDITDTDSSYNNTESGNCDYDAMTEQPKTFNRFLTQ